MKPTRKRAYALTPEQKDCVDAFLDGKDIVINAGAGTGKTSTALEMAEAAGVRRYGSYIAFNKSIADEAKAKFPRNVHCGTAHHFAFKTHGLPFKHRLDAPRVPARIAAQILGIQDVFKLGPGRVLQPSALASMAVGTVGRFCYSDKQEISKYHIPKRPGVDTADDSVRAELFDFLLPYANKAWEDLQERNGRLKFNPDHFLKLWALDKPELEGSYVFLDEGQDTNPVLNKVFFDQDVQKVIVGDQAQQIYGWRGADDAMAQFDADVHLYLTQSFRFGPAVANEANKWLSLLDAPLRLRGFEKIKSTIGQIDIPRAVLCRTNAGVIAEAIHAIDNNVTVAVVGGTNDIKYMAEAAQKLQQTSNGCDHPELAAFKTWPEVQAYVNEEEDAKDLRVFVKLVDDHGPEEVIRIADRAGGNEKYAQLVLSTAHKAKGREWESVKVGNDFMPPEPDAGLDRSEAMLSYVTVTRAQQQLDRGPLEWIDKKTLGNVHNLPVEEEE